MISISRAIKCYGNPIIIAGAAMLFALFPGDAAVETIGLLESAADPGVLLYVGVLAVAMFGFLSAWAFSFGALITVAQLVYALVRYILSADKRREYVHYFYGFAIAMLGYVTMLALTLAPKAGVQ